MMAPARRAARAGAIAFAAAALVTGCDRVGSLADGPAVLELTADTIQLPDSVSLIEVIVRRASGGEFEPTMVTAASGDVVRFTAGDAGSHALVFDGAALPPEQRAFLDGTGQMRSPPLIHAGAAWVVSLAGAPAGTYPFTCVTHSASGVLTVER
ncbi:MAG: plastocyanin/azurin family copper-binding protein [Gemmatimonadota bacterium]